MKCIVFVNRIVTARCLSHILQNLNLLTSWKCDYLVGVHSGWKSMSRKTMNDILEKFRTGKLNLLIATKVGEEGLDIQTCCLVIRFDLPETVASFIQSRGRARMHQSEYAFLVDRCNQKELDLIEDFKNNEERMNFEISSRTSNEDFVNLEEKVYKVDVSGASVSSAYSISLLHHYCSKLPHDEYFDPKPQYFYFEDGRGTICGIYLPANAPLHLIVGTPESSMEAAKKDACLKAIEQLHKVGALTNFLLPTEEDADEESMPDPCDSVESEVGGSRGELHEMVVPAILKESWTTWKNSICLNSYYIEFSPVPEDRTYTKFGLFVKAPLPLEAEQMQLELHLAHGRYVETKLFHSVSLEFNIDEITQAMNFQEMFLKVILDRKEFESEYVPLVNNCFQKSIPTFYLLLPVLQDSGNMINVDWEVVRRCISSPVFTGFERECIPSDPHLQLANGRRNISDIVNSLVYVPHRKRFYFVDNVVYGKDAHSPYKGSDGPSHLQHYFEMFGVELKYPNQLLLHAKQLFNLHNLLHDRRQAATVIEELDEYFIDLPPELCELKIIGFSKDIGSSISLLPSIMHRLENLLVAIELKSMLSDSFPEGAEVTAYRVLEALTTERCQERLSLERLEILGDAFLKYSVGRRLFLLHETLDEGELTRRRSNAVNNSNLFKLAIAKNLQVYIRDQPFDPSQFFALGRPCRKFCTKDSEWSIHYHNGSHAAGQGNANEVRCSKGHHWLHKKTIADIVEALIGAFIVDSGFKAAAAFLNWLGINVNFESAEVMSICQASSKFTSLAPSMDVSSLESSLGHRFLHKGLLLQAFVHPSYNKHGGGCYQRLEFLGDAVLDYLITSYLFSVYPKLKPGHLTDLRSALVNNRAFANVSIDRSFHKFIICDSSKLTEAIKKYEDSFKGLASDQALLEGVKCPKVLGDLVESCLGATLLDKGFNLNYIWDLMISFLGPLLNSSTVQLSPYRELTELCQSRNWELQYPTILKGKMFWVEAKVNGKDVCLSASASNPNKKEAIRIASEQIFVKLKEQGYIPNLNYLERILRTTTKMEPKLIGYDETPIELSAPPVTELESLRIEEPGEGIYLNPKISRVNAAVRAKQPYSASQAAGPSQIYSPLTGGSSQKSAKSRLYEICAANCWKPPLFECVLDQGPSHLKIYRYKVVVQMEAPETTELECYGEDKATKKNAAEDAAQGALWYLKQQGFLL